MPSPQTLPTDSQARKDIPLARGCLDYFPAALAEVAKLSRVGNEKHNPGEDLHHARGKSSDHADTILRHLLDRGTVDPDDNIRHSTKVAWRALALLQEELEAGGAPLARGARVMTAAVAADLTRQFRAFAELSEPEFDPAINEEHGRAAHGARGSRRRQPARCRACFWNR